MLHYTCDLCGETLARERFVVRMEVFPAFDPEELDEESLDADHLDELAELLSDSENADYEVEDVSAKRFRFDLCPCCRERYIEDPLGRERLLRLKYSNN